MPAEHMPASVRKHLERHAALVQSTAQREHDACTLPIGSFRVEDSRWNMNIVIRHQRRAAEAHEAQAWIVQALLGIRPVLIRVEDEGEGR